MNILFVHITFHYVEEKIKYLEKVLESLREISYDKMIVIHMNDVPDLVKKTLLDRLDKITPTYILRTRWDNPFMLTWAHKGFIKIFLDTKLTHFIYLEDDIELTQTTLDYWIETRELFQRNNMNFIPGVFRIEQSGKETYSLDFTYPIKPKFTIIEGKRFFSPEQPYQGMYIMDKDLAYEHYNSPNSRPDFPVHNLGIRELANCSYLYHNVPQGYPNRSLLPLDNFKKCWVHHLTDNYCKNPDDPHGKILVEDILL